MSKKEQTLLIWILTVAVSIVLVLYSPVGSPEMYNHKQYMAMNQGVSFSGKIQNAPKSIKSRQDSKNELSSLTKDVEVADYKLSTGEETDAKIEAADPTAGKEIPTYSNKPKTKANYAVNNTGGSSSKNNTTYAVNQSSAHIEKASSQGGGGAGGGMPTYSSSRGNNNNSGPQNTGFTAMSIDMSIFSDSTSNRQQAGYGELLGGTDPGGNPIDEPIPVGEGWWILLTLATLYAVYTKLRIAKA